MLRVIILSLLLLPVAVCAAGPSVEPLLSLETGMHTALIRGITTDRAGRFLVTASDDKTARIWEIASTQPPSTVGGGSAVLRLLRVLRPPAGAGHEGKLNAVAIAPDGSVVACGGWTGWDRDGKGSVYLFNRSDGSLTERLSGFPEVVKGLAFSPDGVYLAVTLGGRGGLYILCTVGWKPVLIDREYGGDAYGVAFSSDGRLVTTSWDGYVRLYDRHLKPVARRKLESGDRPFGIAFSPDGSLVAVGSVDSPRLEVLSGRDLALSHAPDTKGPADGSFSSVAWGAGNDLFAAGNSRSAKGFLLRRWADAGRGAAVDYPVASGDILALASLPGGEIAFAGAAPEVGIITRSGERRSFRGADIADFRDTQPNFRVSADGTTVQFGFGPTGTARTRFSLGDRLLDGAPLPAKGLILPIVSSPELFVENWLNGAAPFLNGVPLRLDRFETARSLAVFPDNKGLVLGTDWSIHCFDRNGKNRWRVSSPGIAWGVNVTQNGRFVVAIFGDGTIRWYRAVDGRELLALFPHRDKKRWLLWTPSGYYDASPGGEELAGWHLNNNPNQAADFFPVSRFRAVYRRPDVIARVLAVGDEREAVRLADAASERKGETRAITALLPPVVDIRAPADGSKIDSNETVVAFVVRSPSGEPVTGVRVLVNGRPVQFREKETVPGAGSRELTVPLPVGESEIAVIAENRNAAGEPATVRVTRTGTEPIEEISIQPRLFILAVGVGAYPDKDLALDYAAKDANDFVSLMLRQKGELYGEVTVKVLTDDAATRGAVLDGLAWLKQQAVGRDTVVVFLSGHGVTEPNGIYYYLPVDGDPNKPGETAVVFSTIRNTLMALPGKAILFVDTCHAGDVMGGGRAAAVVDGVVNELASAENGVVVFASSTGRQISLEDESWGNGAFTKALVEGIAGKADYTGKGKITVTGLDLWLSERVPELTEGKQTPTTAKPRTIPDFPLAMKVKRPE